MRIRDFFCSTIARLGSSQSGRPETAEIALTIVDAWQHRGVGTQLLQLLMNRADRVGVRTFRAVVAADNLEALGLLRKVGRYIRLIGTAPGVAEYEITPARALA
jgi:L-amino acid N-acyltransferase YncA